MTRIWLASRMVDNRWAMTSEVRPASAVARARWTAASDSEILVTISDDGCGIPAEALERLFDPFFTTKPGGEGTGLGLVISYEIVRKHGGDILLESELGRGTTVQIRLPIAPV